MPATAKDTTSQIHAAIAEGDRPGVAEPAVTTAKSPPRRRKVRKITRKILVERLGAAVVTYLDGLTLQQLLCLAYGHIWPVLVPGRGRPKGWRANLAPEMTEGVFLITENCIRDEDQSGSTCGSERTTYTGEHGIFMERGRHRQYKRDKSIWQIRPEGSRISRIDVLDYIFYLMGAELFTDADEGDGGLA